MIKDNLVALIVLCLFLSWGLLEGNSEGGIFPCSCWTGSSVCSPLRVRNTTPLHDFKAVPLTSQVGSGCGSVFQTATVVFRQAVTNHSLTVEMLKAVILIGGPQKGRTTMQSIVVYSESLWGQNEAKLLMLGVWLSLFISLTWHNATHHTNKHTCIKTLIILIHHYNIFMIITLSRSI